MDKSLRDELSALALYFRTSGSDADYKVSYGISKIELLLRKYEGEFGDESQDSK